jgi:hypothetical protein
MLRVRSRCNLEASDGRFGGDEPVSATRDTDGPIGTNLLALLRQVNELSDDLTATNVAYRSGGRDNHGIRGEACPLVEMAALVAGADDEKLALAEDDVFKLRQRHVRLALTSPYADARVVMPTVTVDHDNT